MEPRNRTEAVPRTSAGVVGRAHLLLARERKRRRAQLLFVEDQLVANRRRHPAGDRTARRRSEERAVLLGMRERHREALAEIDAALRRLRDGTYGVCERCAKLIEHEHLDAMPTARNCLVCHQREPDSGVAASRWVVGDVVVPPQWTPR